MRTQNILSVISTVLVVATSVYGTPDAVLTSNMDVAVTQDYISVTYDASGSTGTIVQYEWDFDYTGTFSADYTETATNCADGVFDGITSYAYTSGDYQRTVMVRVTDGDTLTDTDTCSVIFRDTIQEGVDQATTNGDIVVVAPGVYTGTNNWNIDFDGKAITLQSIDPTDPNIVERTTIDCYDGYLNYYVNKQRAFYFQHGETYSAIVNGLTVRCGWHTYTESFLEGCGGGILCEGSSPTIKNCVIRACRGTYGGGIACCYHLEGETITSSSPRIVNCLFRDNEVDGLGKGSAIFIESNCDAWIEGCTFFGNTGYRGGAIAVCGDADISDCIFRANSVTHIGGGVYVDEDSGTVDVDACLFIDNNASFGGGLGSEYASPEVRNCVFVENNGGTNGGGLYSRGGTSSLHVLNCVFFENTTGGNGGGLYNFGSSPTIMNCTFNENAALSHGGAIASTKDSQVISNPQVTNCILYGDTANGTVEEVYNESGCSTAVNYSCVQNYTGGGTGNTTSNPQFAFSPSGDGEGPDETWGTDDDCFVLKTSSPCLDHGSNAALSGMSMTTDISGHTRIVDTGWQSGAVVDMRYCQMLWMRFFSTQRQNRFAG